MYSRKTRPKERRPRNVCDCEAHQKDTNSLGDAGNFSSCGHLNILMDTNMYLTTCLAPRGEPGDTRQRMTDTPVSPDKVKWAMKLTRIRGVPVFCHCLLGLYLVAEIGSAFRYESHFMWLLTNLALVMMMIDTSTITIRDIQ